MRRILSILALLMCAANGWASDSAADVNREPVAKHPSHGMAATYDVQAGLDGEIYPAFTNFASLQRVSERKWGTVSIKIENPTGQTLSNRITVSVPGWSDEEIQIVDLSAGETRTVLFAPSFLPRLYRNREITAATVLVQATDAGGRTVMSRTVPVRLRSAEDLYWGTNFKYATFIATWVTPHDPQVELLLGRAKELNTGRRLPGYETWKPSAEQERSTYQQAKAVYEALQRKGVSYVKSSMTLGGNSAWSERVRLPREALTNGSANCIDAVVLYASLFENLGMEPAIVIVPGHAYVGVRVAQDSDRFLLVDVALMGRVKFEEAVRAAEAGIQKFPESRIHRIIYPQSAPGRDLPHARSGRQCTTSGAARTPARVARRTATLERMGPSHPRTGGTQRLQLGS